VPETRLAFGAPPRVLEAVLHEPAGSPRGGAVVCHPHPLYGGDMDVGVVVTLARALAERGWAALRFNFGGVGRSGGRHSGGAAERDDVASAVDALDARLPAGAPLAVVGYSFGAWVGAMAAAELARPTAVVAVAPPLALLDWRFLPRLAKPLFVVAGDHDEYCPAQTLANLERVCGGPVVVTTLEGADHFLAGAEARVAFAACAHLGLA